VNEDKATRYHRRQRITAVASLCWTVSLLVLSVVTGASIALRETSARIAHAAPRTTSPLVVIVYTVLLTLILEVSGLPFTFYSGFVMERRYGLSTQRFAAWLLDQAKALLLGLALGAGAAVVLYSLIARSPDRWWLPAGLVFAAVIVGLANLGPVLFLPIFYSLRPLDRAPLRDRLLTLANRAGVAALDVYEWGLAAKTRKANAALTGLGGTRRILVSDTMLAEYSDDEIEVVLAHELGHHVHRDIWSGLLLESVLILGGFYAAAWLLRVASAWAGLSGPADVAGLPLLFLAAGAVSLVAVPIAHAISRAHERRADRYALEMTRNPSAFISAMRRLGAQNLAEEQPSRIVEWLFHSHPPIGERVAAAEGFARRAG
jgi:STE24 endopeptidase